VDNDKSEKIVLEHQSYIADSDWSKTLSSLPNQGFEVFKRRQRQWIRSIVEMIRTTELHERQYKRPSA
jgi:hypothetical protein